MDSRKGPVPMSTALGLDREPVTHDRTSRGWGHDHGIRNVRDGGRKLSVYAWGGNPVAGDYLILPQTDGTRDTARYQTTSIEWPGNPRDQWFAECAFAPRGADPEDGATEQSSRSGRDQ